MIKKRYQAKACDACGKTLAIKRKIFYETIHTYVTIRKNANSYDGLGRSQVHLCKSCFNAIIDRLENPSMEREEKHVGNSDA